MTDREVITRTLERLRLSVADLAEIIDISDNSIRKWLAGGGITEANKERVATKLGFDSWGQLERFVVPFDGELFVLRHQARDLGRVWEHYVGRAVTPIFETHVALSFDKHSIRTKTNTRIRRMIVEGSVTVHRVEQPRTIARLAELACNAWYFRRQQNYALRLVAPQKDASLFTYPNLTRFGKKVLVLGR